MGFYRDYLKSKDWKETKKYLSVITKRRCYVCHTRKYINTHHYHYRSLGYEDGSELVFLCREHHKRVHFKDGQKLPIGSREDEERMRRTVREMKHEFFKTKHVRRKFRWAVLRAESENDKMDEEYRAIMGY